MPGIGIRIGIEISASSRFIENYTTPNKLVSQSFVGTPYVAHTAATAIGVESATQVAAAIAGGVVLTPSGVESATQVGAAVVHITEITATGVESASEIGGPAVSETGDTTAPTMTSVNFNESTSVFSATLSEAATLHFLVDSTEPTTANAIINGSGLYKTTVNVGAGGSSEPMEFSSVQAGTHWLGVIPEDASGNSDFAQAHVAQYTFSGPYVATGVESASEVGAATASTTSVTASGVESASEVGTAAIVSGVWAYTGSVVTNLPANEGWGFTGSVIDTIPAAA